ncbi:MAG: c-type cytochrome [Phormidesmis sp. RL_2_1]|nr:c-type cytochrome [Phormidesmis sp. RL_2_1]
MSTARASPSFSIDTAGDTAGKAFAPVELSADDVEPSESAGAALFTTQCAACHANGGNIVRRGKNLKQRAMSRNGYGEVGAIAALIAQGKGAMPAYADRLTEAEISAIAQYVHQQSLSGW